jgi:glucosylceramidase
MTGSHTPNGLRSDQHVMTAWARYISLFISAYENHGVPIWAITPQNEPEFPAPWEACSYNASFESYFVEKFLGPVLRSEHPEVCLPAPLPLSDFTSLSPAL